MKDHLTVPELERTCRELRRHVVSMIHTAQSGHPGGSLSAAELSPISPASSPVLTAGASPSSTMLLPCSPPLTPLSAEKLP